MVNKWLIIILMAMKVLAASAIDLSKENLAYQYNPTSEIRMSSYMQETDDAFIVFTKTIYTNTTKNDWKLGYQVQPNYFSEEDKSIDPYIDSDILLDSGNVVLSKITLPKYIVDSILVIQFSKLSNRQKYFFDVSIYSRLEFPKPEFDPFYYVGLPQLDKYLLTELKYTNPNNHPLFGYYYSFDFPFGLAPMTAAQRQNNGIFRIDSTFIIPANSEVIFRKKGLYLFQKDTSSQNASAYYVESDYFPKYHTLDELINCTRYILTTQEFRLVDVKRDKKAFDEMWLNMTNNPNYAINLIRDYYNGIADANIFFTSYKEGWKTDQGMIYTIFGPPPMLVKGEDFELWSYQETDYREEIKFTFVKVKDVFSRHHYELVRSVDHGSAWLKEIRKWRSGK